ncbi:MAG: hypothetical protein ABSA76_01930 [Bacteroidales bacterium]
MKRRDRINKVVLVGTTLVFLSSVLTSCSKKDEAIQEKTLTIDLNDQANAALLTVRGYTVIDNKIIIAYTGFSDLPYTAADCACTYCGGQLKYSGYSYVIWECSDCHTTFGFDGSIYSGPATTTLKHYIVSKLGNILTVHL